MQRAAKIVGAAKVTGSVKSCVVMMGMERAIARQAMSAAAAIRYADDFGFGGLSGVVCALNVRRGAPARINWAMVDDIKRWLSAYMRRMTLLFAAEIIRSAKYNIKTFCGRGSRYLEKSTPIGGA